MAGSMFEICDVCGRHLFVDIFGLLFCFFLCVYLVILFKSRSSEKDVNTWGKIKFVCVRKSLIDEYRRTYNDYMPGKCGSSMTDNEIVECALSCDIRSMQGDIHGWRLQAEAIWKEMEEAQKGGKSDE